MTHFTILVNLIFLLFIFSNCSATSKLIETAVNISSTYYNHHFVTTVIWKYNDSEYVNEYLQNYPGSVVLSPWYGNNDRDIRDINETVGFKQTIYFATTLQEYAKFMQLYNEITRFPVLFILVLENIVKNPSELSAFIEVSWKNDQSDLVIISADDRDEITLSTFFPYSEGVCGNYTPIFLKYGDNMFPKKFNNFHHCPIRIALLAFKPYVTVETENGKITSVGGQDGTILTIILNKLNASLDVTSADRDVFGTFINGSPTGSIGDLCSGKADILIPAGILTHKRYSVTLPSYIYHTVDIRWVGPKQREIYDWLKVLVPDKTNFTPLHGLVFSAFVIVAMLTRTRKPHLTNAKNNILYQSFIILLGQSAKFVTKSSLLNGLFLLWIWFCFFIRIDYQADLVEALQNVILEPPFESVEEAVSKLDGYGGAEVFLDYYRDTPLEHNYKIVPILEIKSYVQRVFEGENFLLATDISLVRQIYPHVQILERRISSTSTCFFMRPGWPAAKDVDNIIFSLVESGFVENLLSNSDHSWMIHRHYDDVEDLEPKGLSMLTLINCFYGLALMWVICSIIFAIEIIYYNYKFKKQPRWIN